MIRLHRSYPFDVLHCHGIYPTGYLASLGRSRWPATPTIITSHRARDYGDRKGQSILFIGIHATAGTNSLGWLKGNRNGTSIHVLIAKNGTSYVMVDDDHAANHVGFSRYEHGGIAYWKQIVLFGSDPSGTPHVVAQARATGDLCSQTDRLLDGQTR